MITSRSSVEAGVALGQGTEKKNVENNVKDGENVGEAGLHGRKFPFELKYLWR